MDQRRLAALAILGAAAWVASRPQGAPDLGLRAPGNENNEGSEDAAGGGWLGTVTRGAQEAAGAVIRPLKRIIPLSDSSDDNDQGGSMGDSSQPRGIRNHNPGNIEYTGTQWQGLADPPSDGRFMRFTAPEYGIRAMARTLDTYATRHGLDTVGGIIQRWAPAHENNSAAYAAFVADHLGVRATDRIDVSRRAPEMIAAMIEMENGEQPYSMATIREGVALA